MLHMLGRTKKLGEHTPRKRFKKKKVGEHGLGSKPRYRGMSEE
jgi:hypothetical protein